eukprot:TRINITY_DN48269_c0_g1_i1.p1 TRINITY_DN48269_c0_g1~~TRINITY_DN48269_c0_g1_i1.p1  ORF type:complete len:541 (-),score=70.82 TRINITY_DN48269_c0_g1_i1:184-1623(-)
MADDATPEGGGLIDIQFSPCGAQRIKSLADEDGLAAEAQREADDDMKAFELPQECCICYETFTDDEDLKAMPCVAQHCPSVYHESCIKAWLAKDGSCPLCRRYYPEFAPPTRAPAADLDIDNTGLLDILAHAVLWGDGHSLLDPPLLEGNDLRRSPQERWLPARELMSRIREQQAAQQALLFAAAGLAPDSDDESERQESHSGSRLSSHGSANRPSSREYVLARSGASTRSLTSMSDRDHALAFFGRPSSSASSRQRYRPASHGDQEEDEEDLQQQRLHHRMTRNAQSLRALQSRSGGSSRSGSVPLQFHHERPEYLEDLRPLHTLVRAGQAESRRRQVAAAVANPGNDVVREELQRWLPAVRTRSSGAVSRRQQALGGRAALSASTGMLQESASNPRQRLPSTTAVVRSSNVAEQRSSTSQSWWSGGPFGLRQSRQAAATRCPADAENTRPASIASQRASSSAGFVARVRAIAGSFRS